MSPQFRAAFVRAFGGAVLSFLITFFATYAAVEDDCRAKEPPLTKDCEAGTDSKMTKALMPSGGAAAAYLFARFGLEGAYDTKRQRDGNIKEGDVTGGGG
jgi:hypothetical protein